MNIIPEQQKLEPIKQIGKFPQFPSMIYENELPDFPRFKKYIIDTDAGGDDVHAIMLAFHIISKYRQDAEIVGITAVAGNTDIENVVKNVSIALKSSQLVNTPGIYKGCHHDALRFTYRDDYFMKDGMGGVQEKYLKHFKIHEKEFEEYHEEIHAVDFIYESALKYGDQLCVICLGPLTNIFLANQLYPQLPQMMGGICVMGGTYLSVGNTNNSCGEFNFHTDVEAAAAVIQAPYKFMSVLPFDLALGLELEAHQVASIFKNSQDTCKSRLVREIFEFIYNDENPYLLCDQLCVLVALMPDTISHGFKKSIYICKDGYARGQMVIDWLGKMKSNQVRCIVTGVHQERVFHIVSEVNEDVVN